MDFLEPYIGSRLGVALQAGNNQYLSLIGDRSIEAAKEAKDSYTKFIIKETNGHILLQSAGNGRYLKLYIHDGIQSIFAASEGEPDVWCLFQVFNLGQGRIAIKCVKNDMFLGWVIRNGKNYIDASKDQIDKKYATFVVETGSITPVREEILSINWRSEIWRYYESIKKPVVVLTKEVENNGSETVGSDISMVWTLEESSETSWESAWGVTAGPLTFAANYAEAPAKFHLEVFYNGAKTGNHSQIKSRSITQNTRVKIPSKKKVIAQLTVDMVEKATIPFTAKVRRSSELGVEEFERNGVWTGVMVFSSYINIHEVNRYFIH